MKSNSKGVVGQEITFDFQGEDKQGVIKEITDMGDYIVTTNDGRNVLAEEHDVIELGEMRKEPIAPKKRFAFFESGGDLDGEIRELKGYRVRVWSSDLGSSSNLLNNKKSAILVTDGRTGDSSTVMENEPYLKLVEREISGKKVIHAIPVNYGNEGKHKMFGGNFVWSTDSRFRNDVSEQPVALHDRVEFAEGGKIPTKYKIFEGYDRFNNEPLYKVTDNEDYEGEWHTNKSDAEKELNELNDSFAQGGNIEKENNQMLHNQAKEAKHHVDELHKILTSKTHIEPWVVAKMERATTDLSDVTHYLDGNNSKYESGGSIDQRGDYMLLGRLQSDCEYFLGFGNGNEGSLWAGNVKDQIAEMKSIYNRLEVKPEWITMKDINKYERQMKAKIAEKSQMSKGAGVDEYIFLLKENGIGIDVALITKQKAEKIQEIINKESKSSNKENHYEARIIENNIVIDIANISRKTAIEIQDELNKKMAEGGNTSLNMQGWNFVMLSPLNQKAIKKTLSFLKSHNIKMNYDGTNNWPSKGYGEEVFKDESFMPSYIFDLNNFENRDSIQKDIMTLDDNIDVYWSKKTPQWVYDLNSDEMGNGGKLGSNFNPKSFTMEELNNHINDKDIYISYFMSGKSESETKSQFIFTSTASLAFKQWKDKKLTISDFGQIEVDKGSENIGLAIIVYEGESEKPYTIRLYSKDNISGLKEFAKSLITKMGSGGKLTAAQKSKIEKVMHEFKEGELHSGSKRGPVVKKRDQAIAIALAEANASKKMADGGGVDTNIESTILTEEENATLKDYIKHPIFKNFKEIDTFSSGGGYNHTMILLSNNHIVTINWESGDVQYSYYTYKSIEEYAGEPEDDEKGWDNEFNAPELIDGFPNYSDLDDKTFLDRMMATKKAVGGKMTGWKHKK